MKRVPGSFSASPSKSDSFSHLKYLLGYNEYLSRCSQLQKCGPSINRVESSERAQVCHPFRSLSTNCKTWLMREPLPTVSARCRSPTAEIQHHTIDCPLDFPSCSSYDDKMMLALLLSIGRLVLVCVFEWISYCSEIIYVRTST